MAKRISRSRVPTSSNAARSLPHFDKKEFRAAPQNFLGDDGRFGLRLALEDLALFDTFLLYQPVVSVSNHPSSPDYARLVCGQLGHFTRINLWSNERGPPSYDISRVRENEDLIDGDAVFGQRKEYCFLRHVSSARGREGNGIKQRRARGDDPIIAGQSILHRWSEESIQHRLSSRVVAANFDLSCSHEAIDIPPVVRDDFYQGNARKNPWWNRRGINIRPHRHRPIAALVEPIRVERHRVGVARRRKFDLSDMSNHVLQARPRSDRHNAALREGLSSLTNIQPRHPASGATYFCSRWLPWVRSYNLARASGHSARSTIRGQLEK
jgi:hypothetical protein